MTRYDNEEKEKSMTALMNLDQVEALIIEHDHPSANPFELSRKLNDLAAASDNQRFTLVAQQRNQKQG